MQPCTMQLVSWCALGHPCSQCAMNSSQMLSPGPCKPAEGARLVCPQAAQVWAGEPVKAVMVPTSLFLTNKRGFPTLSRAHQALLASFFRLGVQVGPLL